MTRRKALPTMRSSILKLLRCGGEYSTTQIAEHLHEVHLSKGRWDRSVNEVKRSAKPLLAKMKRAQVVICLKEGWYKLPVPPCTDELILSPTISDEVILAALRCDDTSKLAMTSLIEIYNVRRRDDLADAQLDEANFAAGNSRAKKRIKTLEPVCM
ncbi:hypothetical protein FEM48_Zijuj02G0151100 [Ziziphus jujuba var. spinosa]|uniref:Uncharacterized protein n=1 Tax=Ziziphus jujuba var. spinosa TaxID=714518 RepID=A0A978VWD9_ZIZJJ|nr:hypothetical protein FEM48_Zijuj02G0151100 [Ziziphus jujuba var. spinosa]